MKQNVLAFALGVVAIVLVMFVTGAAQVLDQGVQSALDRGDTAAAITLLDKQIELDKGYYYNYYIKGRIYYERQQYQLAAEQFQLAISKKSKHWESVKYFGLAELQLGEVDAAEKAFKDALKKVKEEKAEFEYLYGLVLMARKQYNEADVAFRKAIAIDDNKAEYHIALGDANFFNGVPALAALEYEKAHNLDTASTEVYFHWADACLEMKDYPCAMEKLHLVLAKDSTFAPAWRRAGSIYFKAARSSRTVQDRDARYMDAIGAYNRFFELSNAGADSSTVRENFETAMAYTNIRRYEDALPYFDKVLAIPYEPRDIYFYYGKALWGTRDYVKGAEMLQKHVAWAEQQNEDFQSRVDEDDVYKLLGDCYYYREQRDFSTAVRYYERSLQVSPNQTRVLQNIAVALHTLNRFGEALNYYDLRIAEGIDSASASILKNASLCALSIANQNSQGSSDDMLEEEGDDGGMPGVDPTRNYYQAAADYMTQYLVFQPNDTDVLERLGNTQLYQLADCEQGVATFERLLSLSPNNCQAKKSIGFAYFSGNICRKDLNKTLRYLLQAYECMSSEGPCKDVALVKWIAQAYHLRAVDKTGDVNSDFKNAFDWYGKVLKCTPGDAEAQKGQEDTRFEFN